jgi:hypothetical protein
MAFLIELGATPTAVPDDLDARSDALQEELDKLGHIVDPELLVNLRTGEIIAEMIVEADDMMEATSIAVCALRTAFHAIGENTPGWERLLDEVRTKVEATDLVDA